MCEVSMKFKALLIILLGLPILSFVFPQLRLGTPLARLSTKTVTQRNAHQDLEEKHDSMAVSTVSMFVATLDTFLDDHKSFLFSYADLTKIREETVLQPIGWFFLGTNIAYIISGLFVALSSGDKAVAGVSIELAGLISFIYHFLQIRLGPNRIEVRRSLLVDYLGALSAGILCSLDMLSFLMNVPLGFITQTGGVLVLALTSLATLVRSAMFYEKDQCLEYVFWHSLWHFLSALTAYYVAGI